MEPKLNLMGASLYRNSLQHEIHPTYGHGFSVYLCLPTRVEWLAHNQYTRIARGYLQAEPARRRVYHLGCSTRTTSSGQHQLLVLGQQNRSGRRIEIPRVEQIDGLLVISQFTLYGDCRKGNRPSFVDAAPPEKAEDLYTLYLEEVGKSGIEIASGKFQAMMDVSLVNQGPVTVLLDSKKAF